MSKKKIGSKIILCSFVTVICLHSLFWFLLSDAISLNSNENRELVKRPELTLKNVETYPTEYNKYYNDNMPFRSVLVTLNSAIDYFCFKKSSSSSVVLGKKDWLFYSSVNDGNPIADYQGTNLLSNEELKHIADNCVKQRDFLASKGREFVIFIAPNKERVYSENMPQKYGKPSKENKVKQIVDYLKKNTDLRVVYPLDELMKAKETLKDNIYFKTDTHWNSIGGYIGSKCLLKELGIDMPNVTSKDIHILRKDKYAGDLLEMLNLYAVVDLDDFLYEVNGYKKNQVNCIKNDLFNEIIYTSKNSDKRKLYVCRDSFMSAMAPYVASQFNNSYYRRYDTYSYNDFEQQNPDIFVFEVIERYVDRLGTFDIQDTSNSK